jgi:TRAP-type C4-dicarboxylate transport system permease small subunit
MTPATTLAEATPIAAIASLDIPGELIGLIAVAGGLVVGFTAVFFSAVTNMSKARQRERTRREIAAYVAEGSISPDEGERLMEAGATKSRC